MRIVIEESENSSVDVSQEAMTLDEMEKNAIEKALRDNGGNMSMVSQQLGISRQTLYNKIKKYGL